MATTGTFFVTVLCVIRGYHVYMEGWKPSIGEVFVYFAIPEVYIAIMQCPGVLPLPKLEILPNLESANKSNFLSVEAKLLQVCEL